MIPYALRRWARERPLLLRLFLRWRGRSHLAVQPGRTLICIEGYPRSANSSTFRKFMFANPDAVVAHHTHTVANVAAAVRHGIPALVLIRRPPDPILSTLVAMRTPRPDHALARYLDFYRWVERHLDDVVLEDFETALSDWNGMIRRVNERYGTGFATHEDPAEAERKTREFIHARMDAEGQSRHTTNMPLPAPERVALKDSFRRAVESHPLYPETQQLYERLRARCGATT